MSSTTRGDRVVTRTINVNTKSDDHKRRLEPLTIRGGICISGPVYDSVRKKLDAEFNDLGEQSVKNISIPIHAYDIRWPGEAGKPVGLIAGSVVAVTVIIGLL